eukprot:403998-Hanusia_phi.AAC.1
MKREKGDIWAEGGEGRHVAGWQQKMRREREGSDEAASDVSLAALLLSVNALDDKWGIFQSIDEARQEENVQPSGASSRQAKRSASCSESDELRKEVEMLRSKLASATRCLLPHVAPPHAREASQRKLKGSCRNLGRPLLSCSETGRN